MSVVVHDDMPLELALKLLWRESNRENTPTVFNEQRYNLKDKYKRHEINKQHAKTKRRRRAEKRRLAKKGKIYM